LTYESNLERHQIDLVTMTQRKRQAQARSEIKPWPNSSRNGGLQIEWNRYNDRKEIFDAASGIRSAGRGGRWLASGTDGAGQLRSW
jgi:hypothetical protein